MSFPQTESVIENLQKEKVSEKAIDDAINLLTQFRTLGASLELQIDNLKSEKELLKTEKMNLEQEKENLNGEKVESQGESADLIALNRILETQLNDVTLDRDQFQQERDLLQGTIDQLTNDKQAAELERDEANQKLNSTVSELESMKLDPAIQQAAESIKQEEIKRLERRLAQLKGDPKEEPETVVIPR